MVRCLSIFVLLLFIGCREDSGRSPVIARVGTSELTVADLSDALPDDPNFELSHIQVQRFVQKWVEDELIYQEALSRGFHEQPHIQNEIKRLSRQVVVLAFLERIVDQDVEVGEQEIDEYYEKNGEEFIRADDLYLLNIIHVESRAEANTVRSRLRNGESFAELAGELSLDPSRENGGKLGWVTEERLPTSLNAVLPNLRVGTPSSPRRTPAGYYVLLLDAKRVKGERQELDEVREIIKQRIISRKKEEYHRRLLNTLRQNTELEVDWDQIKEHLADISEQQ